MVRLKEQSIGGFDTSTLISIPYGSIKSSCFNLQKEFEEKISIPYGSIKSRYDGLSYQIGAQVDN